MEDPVEIRRRIERTLRRIARRDDYGRLLARGDVVRRIDGVGDPDAWRARIRHQARADRIKVRTGVTDKVVYAVLAEGWSDARQREDDRYGELLAEAVPHAVRHRHEPAVLVRDGDEVICRCERCPALGFGAAAHVLIGGELFESDCPHEEPPRLTTLAFMYVGPSPEREAE